MTDEKWQNIRGMVLDNFKIEEEGRNELKNIPNAYAEYIIFTGPLGKIKLERTVKPVVLDKKTTYSARAGVADKVEYIYSKDEFSAKFKAYKREDDVWAEMGQEFGNFNF